MQSPVAQKSTHRSRAIVELGVLVAAEVGAVGLLLWLRHLVPAPTALLEADAEVALLGVVWLAAAMLTGWLLLTTLMAFVAYASGVGTAIRAVEWVTLPPVRAIARRATALSLAGATLAGPGTAVASEAPPIPVVVVTEAPAPIEAISTPPAIERRAPAVPLVDVPPVGAPAAGVVAPVMSQPEAAVQPEAEVATYVVKPGDNMWKISAAYLAEETGRRPENPEISRVWRVVMELNEDRIRSGDVDLIFPGEELVLPTLPVAG